MFPASAIADWIRWEPGFRADSGKAVISVDGNPATDGISTIYHFHRVNFEAVLDWRKGDIIHIDPKEPKQWIYTVSEDSAVPLQMAIRLSHVLGYETLQLVDEDGSAIQCRVFMGDLPERKNDVYRMAGSLSYRMQLLRRGKEVIYADDPDGVDYSDAPGMTFHADLVAPFLVESARAPLAISNLEARATPAPDTSTPTHLSVASFGIGAPSWDEIILTFSDNTGTGTIRAGTQVRILLSGVPLRESTHALPCTSDPLPPIVFYSTDRPLHFHLTGISNPGGSGTVKFRDPESGSLIGWLSPDLPLQPTVRADLNLIGNRVVPSSSYLNVTLEADGYFNNQPSMILVTDQYEATPLKDLLSSAWGRQPEPWPSQKPDGRPLWESSMSLCDKLDATVEGIAIPSPGGQFYARHLNARRIVIGSLAANGERSVPAVWQQREKSPLTLSASPGRAECANDELHCRVGGHRTSVDGTMKPVVWTENGSNWIEDILPVPAFCIGGNVLGINDDGVACGYVEIKVSPTPNRLPCVWPLEDSGGYRQPIVLPTPQEAMSGAAIDINLRGAVVGYTEASGGTQRASRWNPSQAGWICEDLAVEGAAVSINWLGVVVGGNTDNSYLWQCDDRIDLSALRGRDVPHDLERTFAIGELGDLIGESGGTETLFCPITTLEF